MFKIHLNKNIYVKNINSYSQNIFNFMGILIFKALKKLIMKKIYSFFSVLFITAAMTAQVNVTYMVDITDYLAAGNVLGAGGIRIGGDFEANGGMNGATPMLSWSPADASCAMTDMGSNIWGIVVTYPDTSVGNVQQYKFVNDNWGTNEGTDVANTIGADGCGSDDGAGNVNRLLTVPAEDLMLQYCWDHCFKCDGSDPIVLGIFDTPTSLGSVTVSPNPVSTNASFNFTLQNASDVTISIFNMMGEEVSSTTSNTSAVGVQSYSVDVTSLPAGSYIYRVVAGEAVTSGNVVKL